MIARNSVTVKSLIEMQTSFTLDFSMLCIVKIDPLRKCHPWKNEHLHTCMSVFVCVTHLSSKGCRVTDMF